MNLNKFIKIQRLVVGLRRSFYQKFWGMDIHDSVVFSMTAKLDKTHPKGMHIGKNTYIAFGASILSHDMVRALKLDTHVGENCFIGARSIIMPGIKIGNGCIVAAGAVVVKDVPSGSIVAGNPAKVIKTDIVTTKFGVLVR
tara:strand:+ start:7153 stop:7575 length:423 start_codon:yes stop_codon:yes gene_type:complete